ncbi:glycosyltransferase family 2 protein [Fuscovulum ytuae]|uniref:Glycosyltransferase family 2 protein n=1 Tax=Fuscovulum ytuae TaxID=3042299 RepID=A0ABY8Q711_9RHOB|nr:glycosyltransferase family 2 protein [Fuscovulum sp. YMD61]WGV15992.1 glycosyltransferase family 2 protein [Fuscovulum sp. YMD61]
MTGKKSPPGPEGVLLVAIMKNEAPYILEWVSHYLALGVEDFLIFSADCNDGTDLMLERLDRLGYLRHSPNPKRILHQIPSWQVGALRYASTFNRFQDAKWVLTVDADEFVDVTPGKHRLADLFDAAEPFDLMSFTVLGHNCNNVRGIGDGKVQGVFTRPMTEFSDYSDPAKNTLASVKTIMRNPQPDAAFRNHRPRFNDFSSTGQRWVNGSGRVLPPEFTNNKVNSIQATDSMAMARVNHYSLRSMDSFLVKVNRGDPLRGNGASLDKKTISVAMDYWLGRNVGLDNTPIHHHVPDGYSEILGDLSKDPILSELHERALDIHARTVRQVLDSEGGQRLAEAMGYFNASGTASGPIKGVA